MALEDKAGKSARGIGASIDSDAIGPHFRFRSIRMPMHDDLPMEILGRQEFISNPDQIPIGLPLEWNSRPYARMCEKIIARAGMSWKAPKEFLMALGEIFRQCLLGSRQVLIA